MTVHRVRMPDDSGNVEGASPSGERNVRCVLLASGEFPESAAVVSGVIDVLQDIDDDKGICIREIAVPRNLALHAHGWARAAGIELRVYDSDARGLEWLLTEFRPEVGYTIVRRPPAESCRLMVDLMRDPSDAPSFPGIDDWVVGAWSALVAAGVEFLSVIVSHGPGANHRGADAD